MKTRSILFPAMACALVIALATITMQAHAIDGPKTYLPVMMGNPAPNPQTGNAIIVDHRHTDISKVPDEWIAQARKFAVHYAHTSHGSQVLSGLDWLEGANAKYNVDANVAGAPSLPPDATALRFYDGNNYGGDNYIYPSMYWESDDGLNHTRSVADTGLFNFSAWTWCGQASEYQDWQIQQYLDALAQLESEYPTMRFIYYTGHTDGTGPGGRLWANNDMIRQYVKDHDKVLFDFADIETYDPDGGGPYLNNSEGTCSWCKSWCSNHPGQCDNLPDTCLHTEYQSEQTLFCKLKGQAFWWLMARLAGWDGVSQ